MNDQKVERIEFVLVPEMSQIETAYRPACVARPDTIGCVAHESETNSHCKRRLCETDRPPTQIEYATGGVFSNGPSSSRVKLRSSRPSFPPQATHSSW